MKKYILIITIIILVLIVGCSKEQTQKRDASVAPDASKSIAPETQNITDQDNQQETIQKLIWPIDCTLNKDCKAKYPDIDKDGKSFDCSDTSHVGHEGTDIDITWEQMDKGVSIFAAADGQVLWVFDGKYDRCPNYTEPDCKPPAENAKPGDNEGYRVCTKGGDFCGLGSCCCFWCFDGGNVIIIRHNNNPNLFATRYDHLKKDSILVSPGEYVKQGQKIGEVGSAGHSTAPHLHFEVWRKGFYDPVDPWVGKCGPNFDVDYGAIFK